MSGIASIVEELIVATVVNGKTLMPRINKTEWALLAFSVFLAATGSLLLVLALDRYLENIYAPDLAALISAAVVFTLALLAVLVRALLQGRESPQIMASQNELGKNIHLLIADVCNELDEPVRENPKTAVAIAALAGFFMANHQTR